MAGGFGGAGFGSFGLEDLDLVFPGHFLIALLAASTDYLYFRYSAFMVLL